jgi:hypothetical protein
LFHDLQITISGVSQSSEFQATQSSHGYLVEPVQTHWDDTVTVIAVPQAVVYENCCQAVYTVVEFVAEYAGGVAQLFQEYQFMQTYVQFNGVAEYVHG